MLYNFGKMIFLIYYSLFFRVKVTGAENIPSSGAAILCSNHASNNDPLVLGARVKRQICFMAKAELSRNALGRFIMSRLGTVPINREKADMESFRGALTALKAGKLLGIFAQGRRIKELDEKDAKAGVALFALKSGAPVIPVRIESKYRPFSRVTIKIGPPVDLSSFAERKVKADVLREAADEIFKNIMRL